MLKTKIQHYKHFRFICLSVFRMVSFPWTLSKTLLPLLLISPSIRLSVVVVQVIDRFMGLRMSEEEERLGADLVEHCVSRANTDSHLVFSGQPSNVDARLAPPTAEARPSQDSSWAQPRHSLDFDRSARAIGSNAEDSARKNSSMADRDGHNDRSQGMNGSARHHSSRAREGPGSVSNGGPGSARSGYTNHGLTGDEPAEPATIYRPSGIPDQRLGDGRPGSARSARASDSLAVSRTSNSRHLLDGGALQRLEQHRQVMPRNRTGSGVLHTSGSNGHEEEIAKFAHIAQVYPA